MHPIRVLRGMNFVRAVRGGVAGLLLAGLGACATAPAPAASSGAIDTSLAQAALRAGAPSDALQFADRVLAQHPNDTAALLTRAEALAKLGQPDPARTDFARVLKREPQSGPALLGLGRLQLGQDPAAAEALLRRAVAAAPGNTAALIDLGIALDLQGRHSAAEAAYRQVLAAHPDLTAARVNLALSLAMRGQGSQAIALLHKLARNPKAGPKLREDYAAVLTMAGEHAPAAAILAADLPPPQAAAALAAFAAASAPIGHPSPGGAEHP
ncbi:MAG: tetratricopeptide repeat protein [Acetobacteraceae bacterium]